MIKKSKIYNALIAAAVITISIVFALGLSEVVVRVFNIGPEFNPVYSKNYTLSDNEILGYELAANTNDGEDFINPDGLRDKTYSVDKPKQVFRIAVVGDSVAFGLRVKQRHAYAKYLERLLNVYRQGETRYEVMNFGVTGYNSKQIVEQVRVKALKYHPDLILYGYCLNDPQEYSLEMVNLLKQKKLTQEIAAPLSSHSRLIMLGKYILGRDGALRKKIEENFLINFQPIHDRNDPQLAALRGGDFVEYFQGLYKQDQYWGRVLNDMDRLQSITVKAETPVVLIVFPLLRDLESYQLTNVHSLVKEAGQKRGMYVLDLLKAYGDISKNGNIKLGVDSLHLTAYGHRYSAVAIINHLHKESLLPGVTTQTLDVMKTRGNKQLAEFMELVQQP